MAKQKTVERARPKEKGKTAPPLPKKEARKSARATLTPPPAEARQWTNQELGTLLNRIADILSIQGEIGFKVVAYRRAADIIEHLSRGVQNIWAGDAKNLREIPGVGEALSEKLDELFRTGRMSYYDKITAQVPVGVLEFLSIPGVGPKTAARFWKDLHITSVAELSEAISSGKLEGRGLGEKTIENLKAGIVTIQGKSTRALLATAYSFAGQMIEGLKEACGTSLVEVDFAGSLRRMKPTIGDLDLLAASKKPQQILDTFVALPQVRKVIEKGGTKASVIAHNGLQVDLRVLEPSRWGTALQYFTGSREHNIRVRELALAKGLSLSEWSLKRIKDEKDILCSTEEQVYKHLGMEWIPPELREAAGEIEAARTKNLPKLVELTDLKGDLQCHSRWSDGRATIADMAEAARKRGLKYIALTDHSKGLGVTGGLDRARAFQQWKEIDALNAGYSDFRILKSVEVEIRADGSLDLDDELLAGFDIVAASTHSSLKQPRDKITARVLRALRHPLVDIYLHPTGRLIGTREESALDIEQMLKVAAETGTIVEVDGTPERMDLDGVHVRRALEVGCKIVIDSDAHNPDGFDDLFWGVAMARRGWATAGDVLNTLEWDELRPRLKRNRR
ncbi:MAG: DNA polymerase/3'-5' exonuclease PolX [Rudaea sp.]